MTDEWREGFLESVDEYLGWDFDEDSLAQWRIHADALATAMLEHPSFDDDYDSYESILEVVDKLVKRRVIAASVAVLVRELDESSSASEYGSYDETVLKQANHIREQLLDELHSCFDPKE